MNDEAVIFEDVNIVFGQRPEVALPMMDRGAQRAEIQKETGQILGVHACSLTVKQGEIVVLMGLSGSGKSTLLRAVNRLNPVVRGRVLVNDHGTMTDVAACDAGDSPPGSAQRRRHGVSAIRAAALAQCARQCRARPRTGGDGTARM